MLLLFNINNVKSQDILIINCNELQDYPKNFIGKTIDIPLSLMYDDRLRPSSIGIEKVAFALMGFSESESNDYYSRYASCGSVVDRDIKLQIPYSISDDLPNMKANDPDKAVFVVGKVISYNKILVKSIRRQYD